MHKQARSFDNKLQDPVIRVTPQLNQRKCFSSSNILVCRSNKVHGCMSEKFTSSNGIIVFNVFFLQICTFSHGEDGGNLLSLQERSCNVSFRLGLAWLGLAHEQEKVKDQLIDIYIFQPMPIVADNGPGPLTIGDIPEYLAREADRSMA